MCYVDAEMGPPMTDLHITDHPLREKGTGPLSVREIHTGKLCFNGISSSGSVSHVHVSKIIYYNFGIFYGYIVADSIIY